MQDNHL